MHYEDVGLSKISVNLIGNISSLGMIDFANGQATGAYHALVKACSVSNSGFSFDLDDFEGWRCPRIHAEFIFDCFIGCYSIWAWDTTSSGSGAACPQISSLEGSSNYSISCEFSGSGCADNVQVIVVSELERTLAVDENSNWSLSI